ncbi:DUF4328 domain-containing protein [Asanoa siamensis]|uniref:DUF4328 domain-containing protein n=1 Tax=Asanoa siamensis TaxID=926357 RepID=A0ABQ4CW69_9ACTN|nr:DUF4328 domain-containing protein [Asanoa siamensis]GIF75527.1 hypothetical protein Asi02nite_50450 [Asanoa siamensis]
MKNEFVYEGHRTYRVRAVGVIAIVLVWLAALAYLVNPVLAWTVSDGLWVGDLDRAVRAEEQIPAASLAVNAVQLLALAATIVWLWRARKNVDAFPYTEVTLGPGWAIGGWFVPGANLYLPGRMVHNVTRESVTAPWARRVAVFWWLTLVGSTALDRIAFVVTLNPFIDERIEKSDAYLLATRIEGAAAVLGLLAAAAFVPVVLRVCAAQEARIRAGQGGVTGVTAAPDAPDAAGSATIGA